MQEQYLFICKNEVSSIADLIRLKIEANQTLEDVGNRQKEIYKERTIRKRKCKTVEDFKEYQIWNLESANELDGLKAEKKQAKSDIRMINACMSENLYTAFGYVDEMEELDYGAEDVLPVMYDYQKRDIAEEFEIVESMDKVLVDEPEIEQSLYDVPEDSFVAKAVSADVSVEKFITVQSLYNDFGNKPIQSFYNNNEGDGLGHDEDRFEATTINTDKKDYDMEEFKAVENVPKVMEPVEADIVKADVVGTEVSTDEEIIAKSAELTIEGKAEQIVMAIQKYYKSYDYLTAENKARLFNFRIDDNSYNLELHAGVLKKLGVLMYGSDKFEDYQSIYEETMKRVEKPNSECERRYYNKEWEREKGR